MTRIMSHGFHVCDSHACMARFMGFDWLKDIAQLTQPSQLEDFAL